MCSASSPTPQSNQHIGVRDLWILWRNLLKHPWHVKICVVQKSKAIKGEFLHVLTSGIQLCVQREKADASHLACHSSIAFCCTRFILLAKSRFTSRSSSSVLTILLILYFFSGYSDLRILALMSSGMSPDKTYKETMPFYRKRHLG